MDSEIEKIRVSLDSMSMQLSELRKVVDVMIETINSKEKEKEDVFKEDIFTVLTILREKLKGDTLILSPTSQTFPISPTFPTSQKPGSEEGSTEESGPRRGKVCSALVKSGPRRGKVCSAPVKAECEDFCGKHKPGHIMGQTWKYYGDCLKSKNTT